MKDMQVEVILERGRRITKYANGIIIVEYFDSFTRTSLTDETIILRA